MNYKSLLPRKIVLILVSLLLVACSKNQPTVTLISPTATYTPIPSTATYTPIPSTATITNTPTPWPSLCEGVEENCIEIIYEGKDCTHVGPEIVPAGQITLVFSNHTSGSIANIDLEKLDEGKTWDDAYNYMSPLPFTGSQPDWSIDVIKSPALDPGKSTTRQKELTAGTYITVCWGSGSYGLWLGGQLIVED